MKYKFNKEDIENSAVVCSNVDQAEAYITWLHENQYPGFDNIPKWVAYWNEYGSRTAYHATRNTYGPKNSYNCCVHFDRVAILTEQLPSDVRFIDNVLYVNNPTRGGFVLPISKSTYFSFSTIKITINDKYKIPFSPEHVDKLIQLITDKPIKEL